ncbi:MAG: lipocalin-like domain-containing protein, partial [Litorilinea sp.]
MKRMLWIVVGSLAVFALAGCAANPDAAGNVRADVITALSGEPNAGFARAYTPITLNFPQDHGAHPEFQTEWWYYTGNLEDADGQRFGYQFTIFRNALTPTLPARASDWATNQVYMAHFGLTHVAQGEHVAFERYSRGGAGLAGASGSPAYAVWLEDWAAREIEPGATHITATALHPDTGQPFAVDLTLRETRAPVLHGDAGLSQKGPEAGVASYYYSLVNMETTGSVTYAGATVAVTGASWMDHEFGTNALSAEAVGWDWFSLTLDNGAVLMFAQIRARTGGQLDEFEGTLVYSDGRQVSIRADD